MFRPAALALLAATLGACATQSYALRTYGHRKPVEVRIGGDLYQVQDRPDLGRLLVSGSAAGTADPSRARLMAVATRFLTEQGRGACQLGDGSAAALPFLEVAYHCVKPRPRPDEPTRREMPRRQPEAASAAPLRMNRI